MARAYATRAAERALRLGAHREAADQYERALRHAQGLGPADVASLLEAYADQASLTDRAAAALDATARAVELRRSLGDPLPLGRTLALHATTLWRAGLSAEADAATLEAITLLEQLEPGAELAEAYSCMASYAMLGGDHDGAMAWGEKAIALAERVGDSGALAQALNSVGSSKLGHGHADGASDLRRSIAVATEAGLDHRVAVAWNNLGSGSGEARDYGTAEEALREAIAFAAERDLDMNLHHATASLARVRFERGDWAQAQTLIADPPLEASAVAAARIEVLGVLGRLRARRGDDPWPTLDQAWALATQTGDPPLLWPVAAARAEAAWLAGDPDAIPALVDETHELARRLGLPWAIGELGLWRWRAGTREPLPDNAAEPYALHIAARFADAAAAWQRLGCPYETADALADRDRPPDLLRALKTFDDLGAAAAAARVRRRLRELGVQRIPRGPRPATAANPAGLTTRQMDVLNLLALGFSDAEIAQRLHISAKTAGHHVSAILTKLSAASRGEAAHTARRLGLTPQDREPPAPT